MTINAGGDSAHPNAIPNTYLVGAAKSGTTSLAHSLSLHSDVCLTSPKETNEFWHKDFHKGLGYYNETFLPHYKGENIILDASTHLLALPFAPIRIDSVSSYDTKIICILREPIERAYSHWWMLHGYNAGFTYSTFEEALAKNLQDFSPWKFETECDIVPYVNDKGGVCKLDIIERGLYSFQIRNYLRVFDANNIKVLFFQDLKKKKWMMGELYSFLGIEPDNPDAEKNIKLGQSSWRPDINLAEALDRSPIVRKVADIYAPYIADLSIMTGRDLVTEWGYDNLDGEYYGRIW